jgi:hypothetical protein
MQPCNAAKGYTLFSSACFHNLFVDQIQRAALKTRYRVHILLQFMTIHEPNMKQLACRMKIQYDFNEKARRKDAIAKT